MLSFTPSRFAPPRAIFLTWMAAFGVVAALHAQILDHNINPASLGKGDWIHQMGAVETRLGASTTQAVINYESTMGMQWIAVKGADGDDTNTWAQFSTNLIAQAHAANIKIFSWVYIYGGTNVPAEINSALTCLDKGADGLIIDAETEYEVVNQSAAAAQYCRGIRARYPNVFLAHSPFPDITIHPNYPYIAFGTYCNAVMPRDYWDDLSHTPDQMISDMDSQWMTWQNGLTGTNRSAIKPIVPIAQAYTPSTGAQIAAFISGIKADTNGASGGGYNGVSFWDCQQRNADMDSAVQPASIGMAAPSSPLLQALVLFGNGSVQLSLNGQTGYSYTIETSSNLVNWIPLSTVINTNGVYQFTDPAAGKNPVGYYRVKWAGY